MKKKSNLVYLLIVLGTFFSCKKFLEEKSNKKLVVVSKLEDLQALLDDAATMNKANPIVTIGMDHIGMNVPDKEQALQFFTEIMGFQHMGSIKRGLSTK